MKNFLLFFLLIFPLGAFSQTYTKGTTLYVWNLDGTALFRNPSFSSAVLDSLKLGTSVTVQAVPVQKQMTVKIVNDSVPLKGYWIKVLSGNKTGYVFGGDCFSVNPFPIIQHGNKKSLISRILGKKTGSKVVKKKVSFDKDTTVYTITYKITYYENGRESESYFDGCYDDDLLFYHTPFTEVYQLMMLTVTFSVAGNNYLDKFERPRLRGVWGATYEFDGPAAIEPQLQIVKNGVRLSLGSCD